LTFHFEYDLTKNPGVKVVAILQLHLMKGENLAGKRGNSNLLSCFDF